MNTRDELIDWLRDAYSMERGLEITLRKQSENTELNALVREQARLHLSETQQHAEAVKGCLGQLGADVSTLKTGIAQLAETAKGFATGFAQDQRIKDMLAAYASEHFEIACYKALRATALVAGEAQIAAVCDDIIADEQKMAHWLDERLPEIVTSYLAQNTTVPASSGVS